MSSVLLFGYTWIALAGAVFADVSGNPQPHIAEWMDLSLECFREYPYLYDGTRESEASYFAFYGKQPTLVMVIAQHPVDQSMVGVLVGISLAEETEHKRQLFTAVGENPMEYFYIVECAVKPAFRSQGIARTLYKLFEEHVRSHYPSCRYISGCSIERTNNPAWYIPEQQNPFYYLARHYGWQRDPKINAHFSWKDVGSDTESSHSMVFWKKQLSRNAESVEPTE